MTLLLVPFAAALLHAQAGNAAVYDQPNDRWNWGRPACQRLLRQRLGMTGWQHALKQGVAHRSLPCGTHLHLGNPRTGRWTPATVVDRGPYGQVKGRRWVARKQLQPGWRWRGIVDLRPGVAAALGITGVEPVVLVVE